MSTRPQASPGQVTSRTVVHNPPLKREGVHNHMYQKKTQRLADEARELYKAADAEGRPLTDIERGRVEDILGEIEGLRKSSELYAKIDGSGAASETAGDGSGPGDGWTRMAKSIASGNRRAEGALVGTALRAKAATGPDSTHPLHESGVYAVGRDIRFIHGFLPTRPVTNELTVTDYRQAGDRVVTGDVERAPTADTTKAELDLQIEHVSEDLRQVAVLITGVPNALLKAVDGLQSFLAEEAQYQLARAIDAHVLGAIGAAGVPNGATGSDLIERARNAVSEVRAAGYAPTLLAVSPEDGASLDLSTRGADGALVFPTGVVGSSSPLWSLNVVEVPNLGDPLVIDTQALGQLYAGQVAVDVDGSRGFSENTSDLRVEGNVLFNLRRAPAAYRIGA
jgi:HK97 family phage major capsid protein